MTVYYDLLFFRTIVEIIQDDHKLNNLSMPLYILMIADGNGEGEIVAVWLVSSEDRNTLKRLWWPFLKSTITTKCIMSDKDLMERGVLKELVPNAVLLICCIIHVEVLNEISQLNIWGNHLVKDRWCTKLVYSSS